MNVSAAGFIHQALQMQTRGVESQPNQGHMSDVIGVLPVVKVKLLALEEEN